MQSRRREDVEIEGEAVVLTADNGAGDTEDAGEAGTIWDLSCRIEPAEGDPIAFEQRIGGALDSASGLSFAPGDTVPVHYDPAHPDNARVDVDELRRRQGVSPSAGEQGGVAQTVRDHLERRGGSDT